MHPGLQRLQPLTDAQPDPRTSAGIETCGIRRQHDRHGVVQLLPEDSLTAAAGRQSPEHAQLAEPGERSLHLPAEPLHLLVGSGKIPPVSPQIPLPTGEGRRQ